MLTILFQVFYIRKELHCTSRDQDSYSLQEPWPYNVLLLIFHLHVPVMSLRVEDRISRFFSNLIREIITVKVQDVLDKGISHECTHNIKPPECSYSI